MGECMHVYTVHAQYYNYGHVYPKMQDMHACMHACMHGRGGPFHAVSSDLDSCIAHAICIVISVYSISVYNYI